MTRLVSKYQISQSSCSAIAVSLPYFPLYLASAFSPCSQIFWVPPPVCERTRNRKTNELPNEQCWAALKSLRQLKTGGREIAWHLEEGGHVASCPARAADALSCLPVAPVAWPHSRRRRDDSGRYTEPVSCSWLVGQGMCLPTWGPCSATSIHHSYIPSRQWEGHNTRKWQSLSFSYHFFLIVFFRYIYHQSLAFLISCFNFRKCAGVV